MINYTPTPDYYNDYICHYNHNHDPKNGQFTTGNGATILAGPMVAVARKARAKQVADDNADMFNDILYRTKFGLTKEERAGAEKEFKKLVKDVSNDFGVPNNIVRKQAIETFERNEEWIEKREARNNLNKPWDYEHEPYEDYAKRLERAYDVYSTAFSNETKKAEKELDSAIKGVTPKDGTSSSAIEKYSGIAGLLSGYYDEDNFEDTTRHMWFYKYEDGDQGSDNSAMVQLVSNYGYEDAKKRINKYRISERNLEESLTNDFGKDEASKLMDARREKDNNKTNYHIYRLNDGEISGPKKRYDEAIKKSKLLNDVVTFHYDVKSAAKQIANKIESARKSGLTYEEIADKYGVSTWFISDVLNNY